MRRARCSHLLFSRTDSPGEQALFACATHVFLQTPDAPRAHEALQTALGPLSLERLNLVLAFVRTAHYWTRLHPELVLEDDIRHLLAAHETLAQCILKDPEAEKDSLGQQVAAELASLRKLRQQHESITQAYQELSVDHQYVKHSLYETEENLRELVAVMPAGIYACDRDGVVTYYNPQAVEIWGRAPILMIRPGHFWIRGGYIRQMGLSCIGGCAGKMGSRDRCSYSVNRELVLERPDLSRINLLANITPLRNAVGIITGAVSVFQDIGELKRGQQEREVLLHELRDI